MANQSSLQFIETNNVANFKSKNNASKIDVLPATEEGKKPFFVTDSGIIGSVSDNVDLQSPNDIMISRVQGDNGDQWYLMHKAPTRENVLATL